MQKYIIAAWSDKINLFFGFFQKNFSHIPRLSGKTSREVSQMLPRPDLAMEAKELFERSAGVEISSSRKEENGAVKIEINIPFPRGKLAG